MAPRFTFNLLQAISDENGQASLKRIITLLAFVCMAVAFFADLLYGRTITHFLYDSMMYVVIGGLSLTVGALAPIVRKARTAINKRTSKEAS